MITFERNGTSSLCIGLPPLATGGSTFKFLPEGNAKIGKPKERYNSTFVLSLCKMKRDYPFFSTYTHIYRSSQTSMYDILRYEQTNENTDICCLWNRSQTAQADLKTNQALLKSSHPLVELSMKMHKHIRLSKED